ncbi:MAG: hypothetical protein QOJ99_3978 [Bryobacterales bacterium]|jgi:anti-sigma factor RsiW|nr:hypothetical protein [Bryobacterales bacterium]
MSVPLDDGCARIHPLLDRYLDGEVDEADSAEFRRHMNECPELADLVKGRTALQTRIRAAVRNSESPPGLEQKVHRALDSRNNHARRWTLVAIAASVLMVFSLTMSWRAGRLSVSSDPQDGYIASIMTGVPRVMQIGLQQHVHCAVLRKRPSPLPNPEQTARDVGPQYGALLSRMRSHLPSEFRILEAHVCSYKGRKYTHITVTNDSRLISLLITNRSQGEAAGSDLQVVATAAGEQLYSVSAAQYSIAGFETRDHFVYLVSDMDSGQNLTRLQRLLPDLSSTVRALET